MNKLILVFAVSFFLLLPFQAMAADEPVVLKAVGTWSTLNNYPKHEAPFFNELLAEVSGGQIVGEIKSINQLGLTGFEIMKLVKNDVFDFGFGVLGYVAAENAVLEGADLSSLTQDINTQRKVADAYFPTLEKEFADTYNSKLLMLYPFNNQMLWCNKEIKSVKDFNGKNIRVWATTTGDFVEGAGGTPVTIPLTEVLPALESGAVDCGVTGVTAYTTNWSRVVTHVYTLRLSGGLAFGAISMNKWKQMTSNQQSIFKKELAKLTDRMWAETALEDEIALACITGKGCKDGKPVSITAVEPSKADLKIRENIATDVVLARWAKRCGAECATNWNQTVGKVLNLKAASK